MSRNNSDQLFKSKHRIYFICGDMKDFYFFPIFGVQHI